jgi:hypothetical protein
MNDNGSPRGIAEPRRADALRVDGRTDGACGRGELAAMAP